MRAEVFEKYVKKMIESYAFPIKARIEKVYPEAGKYWADCVKINLNGSEKNIIFPKLELPKIWGADGAGVFCLPEKGAMVSLGFYEGNPHYPFIMSIYGFKSKKAATSGKFSILYNDTEITLGEKIKIKTKDGNLKEFLEKFLDTVSKIKTVGSPAMHTLDPGVITEITQLKTTDLTKLLE